MARLGTEYAIEVAGFILAREALGHSIRVDRESGDVWRIDMPEVPDSFRTLRATIGGEDPALKDPRQHAPVAVVDRDQAFVTVRMINVVVNFDADLSVETFDNERDGARYDGLLRKYQEQALDLAADFTARLRLTTEQMHIEPTGAYPQLVGAMRLHDLDAGKPFNVLIAPAGWIRMIGEEQILDAQHMDVLGSEMSEGLLEPEESLLSEARYLAHSEAGGSADRATLLAAIAAELRIKRTLRRIARDPNAVALLLENPRDWSMAVHGLYLKALPVFAEHELGPEHEASAKDVQRLFTARNGIAHKGEVITAVDAKAHVEAAREAFRILAAISKGGPVWEARGSEGDAADIDLN